MSLDAGEIKGSLNLDTTEFNKGFAEAHTHAETEGGHIRETLESIAEVASEVAGPAFAQFGQQIQSAFAGFSEGPVVGSLNVVGLAAGAVREAVEGAGGTFHQMGIEAQKVGVSVDFLSRLAAVGGTVGVGVEQLGLGFKILEQRVAEAKDGSKEATDGFAKLGISVKEAAELSKTPEKLFAAVQDRLGAMTDAGDRAYATQQLLGRGGSMLIPIFQMGREEFEKTADQMKRLGGTVSDADVELGESLGKLEGYFHAAWLGIERAVSKPVLKFLQDHMQQIEPKLESIANTLVSALGGAWEILGEAGRVIQPILVEVADALEYLWDQAKLAAAALEREFAPALEALRPITQMSSGVLMDLAKVVAGALHEAFVALKPVIEAIQPILVDIIHFITEAINKLDEAIGKTDKLAAKNNKDAGKAKGPTGGDFNEPSVLEQIDQLRKQEVNLFGTVKLPNAEAITFGRLQDHESKAAKDGNYAEEVKTLQAEIDFLQKVKDMGNAVSALTPALNNLHEQVASATAGGFGTRFSAVDEDGPAFASGGRSGRASGSGVGGNVTYTINVAPSNPGETGRQFAMRAFPMIRDAQRRAADQAAGEAMVAMAQLSMGGGAA